MQTASSYGVLVTGPIDERNGRRDVGLAAVPEAVDGGEGKEEEFSTIFHEWLPFTYALNAVNRSMGRDDLYPFVLAPSVVEKLAFVHDRVVEARLTAL